MTDGFVKVAAAAPDIVVADCAHNADEIVKLAWRASVEAVHILVTPELCLTGATCGDLFLQHTLQQDALSALRAVCEKTADLDILLAVGLPVQSGGRLYSAAAVLHAGNVLGVVPKTFLAPEGELCQTRQFSPAFDDVRYLSDGVLRDVPFGRDLLFTNETNPQVSLAVELGEDLLSPYPPSTLHAEAGATIIANLAARSAVIGSGDALRRAVAAQSARVACAYVLANAGGGESTTDMAFSGRHILAENGHVLAENAPFSGLMAVTDVDCEQVLHERAHKVALFASPGGHMACNYVVSGASPARETPLTRIISPTPFIPADDAELAARCELVLALQTEGLKKRLLHTGVKTAVIGVSGGLDSALALLVTARAFRELERPAADIRAVSMPSFGTTSRTKSNAQTLCEAVGASFETIDITESVRRHFKDIGHDEADTAVVFENAQARMRTMVLMDIANQCGGFVVGTGDLSELALGWCTYNGDHMAMYSVNADVPKTLIPHLLRHGARDFPDIAAPVCDICDTPISPELLPAKDGEICQKTESIVGPYSLHEFFLYYTLRWGFAPKKIFRIARRAFDGVFGGDEILKWMQVFYKRFFGQQFKRNCLPDGPKVGSVGLSPRGGWQMPSDASAAAWLRELEEMGAQ